MLLTDPRTSEAPLDASDAHSIVLEARGGPQGDRPIRLANGQHSVGSGPRCSIRLAAPGVRPMHCLIHVSSAGARVRRWAEGVLLNGETFDEAAFEPGDSLTVGSVIIAYPAAQANDDVAARVASRQPAENESLHRPTGGLPEQSGQEPAENPQPDLEQSANDQLRENSSALSRSRGKTLVAATRRNRDSCRQLNSRLTTTEETLRRTVDDQRRVSGTTAETAANVDALSSQLRAIRDRANVDRAEATETLRGLNAQQSADRERATAEKTNVDLRLDELASELNSVRERAAYAADAKVRLDELSNQLHAVRVRTNAAADAMARLDELSSQLHAVQTRTDTATDALERLSELSHEINAVREQSSLAADAMTRLDELTSQLDLVRDLAADATNSLTRLDELGDQIDSEREQAVADRADATTRLDDLGNQLNEVRSSSVDASHVMSRLDDLSRGLESVRERTAKAADAMARLESLSSQIDVLRDRTAETADFAVRLDELGRQVDALRAQAAETGDTAARLDDLCSQLDDVNERTAETANAITKLDDLSSRLDTEQELATSDRQEMMARLEGLAEQTNRNRDQFERYDGRLAAQEALTERFQEMVAATERLSHESEELIALQERASQEVDRLASELRSTVKQQANLPDQMAAIEVRSTESERQTADLEQRLLSTQQDIEAWQSRSEVQTARIDELESRPTGIEVDSGRIRDRGLKLLQIVRRNRHLGRDMETRLTALEERLSTLATEWHRFQEESPVTSPESLEDEATAWHAITDATDRLSEKYRRLAADQVRTETQLKQLVEARENVANEKSASAEALNMLRKELDQLTQAQRDELQQNLAQFDEFKSEVLQRLQDWESATTDRDESMERCELRLDACDQRLEHWESQLTDNEPQLAQTTSQLESFAERLQDAESQFADRDERIALLEAQLVDVEQRWQGSQTQFGEKICRQLEQTHAEKNSQREQLTELQARLAELEERMQSGESRPKTDPQAAELAECRRQLAAFPPILAELGQRIHDLELRPAHDPDQRSSVDSENDSAEWLSLLGDYGERLQELERKLEDDRQAEERASWQQQFATLHPILAEYAAQVSELRGQIDQLFRAQEVAANAAGDDGHRGQTAWPVSEAVSERTDAVPDASPSEDESTGSWDWSAARAPEPSDAEDESIRAATEVGLDDTKPIESTVPEWSDESQDAAEPCSEPSGSDDQVPQVKADFQPASFIDRFAHLLDEEPADGKTLPLHRTTPELERPSEPLIVSDVSSPATLATPSADSVDEESIEQYMSQMMQRIRGDSSLPIRTGVSPAPAATPTLTPPSTIGQAVSNSHADSEDEDSMAAANVTPVEVEQPQRKPGPAGETRSEMAALRALANRSARHAIGVHTAHHLRRKALIRSLFAVLSIGAGLYIGYHAPAWKSFEFGTGCIALLAALFWGLQTLSAFFKAIRLGAFEDFDLDDEDAYDDDARPLDELRPAPAVDRELHEQPQPTNAGVDSDADVSAEAFNLDTELEEDLLQIAVDAEAALDVDHDFEEVPAEVDVDDEEWSRSVD